MKVLLVFALLLLQIHTDKIIISRPIITQYNQYGQLDNFKIQWKCYSAVYPHNYLKVSFPENIHDTQTTLKYSISTANSYEIVNLQQSEIITGSVYYFKVDANLLKDNWYALTILVNRILTIDYGLVQIQIVGTLITTNSIKRAWNQGFNYYHIQQNSIPDMNIFAVEILSNTIKKSAGNRYPLHIQLSSSISIQQSVQISISFINPEVDITDTAQLLAHTSSGNGFIFTGHCQTLCDVPLTYHCIHAQNCLTSQTQNNIKVTLPYIKSTEKYIIQVYIINPIYSSSTRIQAYWQDNNQQTIALAFSTNLLVVQQILINSEQIRLLWGIPYDTVVNVMGLGLFVNEVNALWETVSSFDIGFSVDKYSPIQGKYQIIMTIGASKILQQSINHNLPQSPNTTPISCRYRFPDIICTNIDSFTKINHRYYIRAKGLFTTNDDLTSFGNIQINLIDEPTQILFTPLIRGLTIQTISNSDYHDYTGLHSGNQFLQIRQSIIVSHKDTLLANSTSNSVKDLLFNDKSFVGIDPSIATQQLTFLMNVDLDQMSVVNPSIQLQIYKMVLYANPSVMNVSNKGLDIQAYSSVAKDWNVQNLPCYVDSSDSTTIQIYMCQKYNDHVYNEQKTNTYVKQQYYHKYQLICGDEDGIRCGDGVNSMDCSDACRIFRGNFATDPSSINSEQAGVLSIRNVTFLKNYHSSIQASVMDLDFVLAFYQNDVFVSASLINAYTLNSTRLKNIRADLVNHYHDTVTHNQGSHSPAWLKINGHFTLTEIGNNIIQSISVYLPQGLTLSNFIESDNNNNIGCSTKLCKGFLGATYFSYDTWSLQQSIQIFNLPSLTQQFTLLFPVVIENPADIEGITIKLNTNTGVTRGIFRINGSAVNQYLFDSDGNNNIIQSWTPVNLWDSTATQWVSDASQYTYKQSISIASMIQYQQTITITMGATVMPITNNASPSCTFSTAHVNIFSDYSYAIANNYQSCVGPFKYKYLNEYYIWSIWCPIYPSATNQIMIYYPLYPNIFGTGFPFGQLFTYQYANTKGQMIGNRKQLASNYLQRSCTTIKMSQYYISASAPQQNLFTIDISPIQLRVGGSLKLSITFPVDIYFNFISCLGVQSAQDILLDCQNNGKIGSIQSIILTNLNQETILVNQIKLNLKTIKSVTATITTTQKYIMDIFLPFTNSATLAASLQGNIFTPYSSHISVCNNTFSYSTLISNNQIYLSNPQLITQSKGYYGIVTFNADFSNFRINFFSTSSLLIKFTEPILNSHSRCEFTPQYSFWKSCQIDATLKIITLFPAHDIKDFTLQVYQIKCSNIITTGLDFNVSMNWMDSGFIVQTSYADIRVSHSAVNVNYNTGVGTLLNKYYNTYGYLAEYQFNLSIPVTNTDLISLYISFPLANIHRNFIECQTFETSWRAILCYPKSRNSLQQIYIEFIPKDASFILLKVYGVHQQVKSIPNTIKILLKKTTDALIESYYIYDIADTLSSTIANQPIQIERLSVNGTNFIEIDYVMPIVHSDSLYIEVDELYTMSYAFSASASSGFLCQINNTDVPCQRVRPNLLKISSTLTHNTLQINTLKFGPMKLYFHQQYDQQFIFFRFYITDLTANQIIYGSHSHLKNYITKPPTTNNIYNLIWQLSNSQIFCHFSYLGYFGYPAKLMTYFHSAFISSFNGQILTPQNHNLRIYGLNMNLGIQTSQISISTLDRNSIGFHLLTFEHNSLKYQDIPPLPIYISNKKCTLQTQFNQYTIFQRGFTIPITINTSLCRPVSPMSVLISVNTPSIVKNQALTTKIIDMYTKIIYIVLQHPSQTLATLNNNYILTISLASNDSVVNSAYNQIPNVIIKVVSSSIIIGNPEGKQPQVNNITAKSINMTLQCNSPSIIYWGIGLYPTMLGIYNQQIQARLIQLQNGLKTTSYDIYSWSQQRYGLSYVRDFNIEKILYIDQLKSGLEYVFKYICVDQTGKASGGKITRFFTLPSNYSLIKVILQFSQTLTYSQANNLACAISDTLIIPYNETITSTFSNCINVSNTYYKNSQHIFDETVSQEGVNKYRYFFYVDSNRITKNNTITRLKAYLGKQAIFLDVALPYYSSMRIDPIQNLDAPVIISKNLTVLLNEFTLTVTTGLTNTYLIAGYMGKHFDPLTMSKPTHYIMKQGYFSNNTKFDKIFSVYGREELTVRFQNLEEGHQYSIFYFLTVDNPALKTRHSQVIYEDFVTAIEQIVDLSNPNLVSILSLLSDFLFFY